MIGLVRYSFFYLVFMGGLVSIILPSYCGIVLMVLGLYGLVFGAELLTLIISAFTIPLGQGLQYFQDDVGRLVFIDASLGLINVLASLCVAFSLILLFLDFHYGSYQPKKVIVDILLPKVPRLLFVPCLLLILVVILFVSSTVSPIWSAGYDVFQQNRYGVLEYLGVVTLLVYCSIPNRTKRITLFIRILFFFLTLVLFSWGFRMAAVMCLLSVVVGEFNGKSFGRFLIIWVVFIGYVFLNLIGALRFGGIPDFGTVIGVGVGKLDNTFTGVIETSLMYMEQSSMIDFTVKIYQFLGYILPVPLSMLPNDVNVANVVYSAYWKVAGGGSLLGFFYYFWFLLPPLIITILFKAYKYGSSHTIYGGLMFILIMSAPRWYLYSPHVIVKFFIMWLLVLILSVLLFSADRRIKSGVKY